LHTASITSPRASPSQVGVGRSRSQRGKNSDWLKFRAITIAGSAISCIWWAIVIDMVKDSHLHVYYSYAPWASNKLTMFIILF